MHYLYAIKRDGPPRLVATFGGDASSRAYVRWATLENSGDRRGKFEQGSALAGADQWMAAGAPLDDADPTQVDHNPTPSML